MEEQSWKRDLAIDGPGGGGGGAAGASKEASRNQEIPGHGTHHLSQLQDDAPAAHTPGSWTTLSSPKWVVDKIMGAAGNLSSAAMSVVQSVRELVHLVRDAEYTFGPGRQPPILMLGIRYDIDSESEAGIGGEVPRRRSFDGDVSEQRERSGIDAARVAQERFKLDVKSRLWFTYRNGMGAIPGTGLTTDAGWGCMHRSGQMLFAQALLYHYLGRQWRLPIGSRYADMPSQYKRILKLFADDASAPLSIHRITQAGTVVGKKAGQWFAPSTVCAALAKLHAEGACGPDCNMQVLLFDTSDGDNTIYKAPVKELLQKGPALLLLPLRLGTHGLDASYIPKISGIFGIPQTVGFVGGHPNSAHYFIASQAKHVFFLDPHTSRPVVNLGAAQDESHLSWHCSETRRMHLQDCDASLAFGFYCKDVNDLEELAACLTAIQGASPGYPAISVAEQKAEIRDDWDDDFDDEDW